MIDIIQTGPLGVNSYIVYLTGSSVFIVDPACCDYSCDADVIITYLTQHNLNPIAILLTHGHFDHVSGIKVLKNKYKSIPILISKEDAHLIGIDSLKSQSITLNSMGFEEFIPFVSNLPEYDVLFDENKPLGKLLTPYIKNKSLIDSLDEWNIIFTPGHTKGSVCIFNNKKNQILTGDTVFYMSYGRYDLPEGDVYDLQNSLKKLRELVPGNTKVYPGHGKFGFIFSDGIVDF